MRLTYIHNVSLASGAANVVQVAKTCEALASLGHSVTLVSPESLRSTNAVTLNNMGIREDTLKLVRVRENKGPGRDWLFTLRACFHAWRQKSELILTRSTTVALISSIIGYRTILELHLRPDQLRRTLQRRFERLLAHRNFVGLIVISEQLKQAVQPQFPRARLCIVPDGAEPVPEDLVPIEQKRNVGTTLQVGYAGHLYAGKGMEILSELARLRPSYDFHIIGGHREDVAMWSTDLQDVPNIVFHGAIAHNQVAAHLAGFDVLAAPYLRIVRSANSPNLNLAVGMSPMKLFEYMALGKAILTSDLAPIREILSDQETALLCDPDDIDQWLVALDDLAQNASLRSTLGMAARIKFIEEFTWIKRAQKIEALFKNG